MDIPVIKKHSELGIISFSLIILDIILFIATVYWNQFVNLSVYFFWCLFIVVPLTTLLLGVVGFIQKRRRKIFPILGTGLSILALLLDVLLVIALVSMQ